jgi:cobyrinic acid a,c-diamide synthase
MTITKQAVADKIAAYLHHEIALAQLVEWAEDAVREGEFAERDMEALRFVIPRLGLADVRAFGLTWEDCEQLLARLGYRARVEVLA